MNAFHYSPADLEKMDAATLRRELHVAQLKILWLGEQLRLERIKKYGRSSEKLNDAQLALLEEEPGVSSAEVEAESRREPVAEAVRREVLAVGYVQADETPVSVPMHDGRGRNHQAYLWQYGQPGGSVVYDFRLGRGRDGPKEFLGNYEGILQTDGYAACEKVGGPGLVHVGCWAHARRGFYEAHPLNPRDSTAEGLVRLSDELFGVDAEARARRLDIAKRDALRQERSRPLLARIRKAVEAAQGEALPSSKLGQAIHYTLGMWAKLERFLEHPVVELSNNVAENSMRPVALGTKNWVHPGSEEAGPRVAAILSVVESCRRLKVSARDYLAAILPGLADVSIQKVPDITPAAWATRQT